MSDKLDIAEHEFNILLYMKHDKVFNNKMCSALERSYFNGRLYGKMFEAIRVYCSKYGDFPSSQSLIGLFKNTNEDKEEVEALVGAIYDEANFDKLMRSDREYITDVAITFAKRAKVKMALLESYELLAEDKFNEIVAKLQDALKFNVDINVGTDLFDVDLRYARLQQSVIDRISTGYNDLDAVLGGVGWCRKELYCILGPPGMGKSIFLPNFGLKAIMNNKNVVHYTLEMSEERVGLRYDGPMVNLKLSELSDNLSKVKDKYSMVKPHTGRLIIKEFPTAGASVLDLEAHIELLKTYENFVPDVIIVDYGDIMVAAHKNNNNYEEQGWIFRELRGLAQKFNCVIITATQAKRDSLGQNGGTKATVGMDQVADSMEKNRILDGLFSIVQTPTDKAASTIRLWIAKNRNGPSGKFVDFKISYEKMAIYSIETNTEAKDKKDSSIDDTDEEFVDKIVKSSISSQDLNEKYGQPNKNSTYLTGKVVDSGEEEED